MIVITAVVVRDVSLRYSIVNPGAFVGVVVGTGTTTPFRVASE